MCGIYGGLRNPYANRFQSVMTGVGMHRERETESGRKTFAYPLDLASLRQQKDVSSKLGRFWSEIIQTEEGKDERDFFCKMEKDE